MARSQLRSLDERNALVASQVRKLNDRPLQLPGLSEPRCRPDQKRCYYHANMLFLDEAKAGFSRDAMLNFRSADLCRRARASGPVRQGVREGVGKPGQTGKGVAAGVDLVRGPQ